MNRILLPVALLLTLVGYFGPWIDHAAAGLVITGLDLGEIVKFLPDVRNGHIRLWRPGFYAPLAATSVAALFAAYRPIFRFALWLRIALLIVALVAAANLVPPAWTPARLLEAEFRVQTVTLAILLAGLAVSPFLALVPLRLAASVITLLSAAALVLPFYGFWQVLPAFSDLYRRPLVPAWGPWLMALGLITLNLAYWLPVRRSQ